MFRGLMVALIGVALAMVAYRFVELAGIAADVRPPARFTIVFLFFALYAAALASYVAWRLPDRTEARLLSFVFGLTALMLAVGVTPSGTAELFAKLIVTGGWAISLACVMQFASRFPTRLTAADLTGARTVAASRLVTRIDDILEPFARLYLARPSLVWMLLLACVPLTYVMAMPGVAYRYNLMYTSAESPLQWLAMVRGLVFMLIMTFPVALVWSGYRRATPVARRQAQWLVLGALFGLLWISFTMVILILSRSVDIALVQAAGRAVNHVTLQVMFFVLITAPFIAVLYGGALDLRPVIQRTSLYGLTLVTITVLFTGVEQLVSSQLTDRLGLPDGTGSWLGGVAVALALMPLQDRIKGWIKRFGG